jgi:hypothetical protein
MIGEDTGPIEIGPDEKGHLKKNKVSVNRS